MIGEEGMLEVDRCRGDLVAISPTLIFPTGLAMKNLHLFQQVYHQVNEGHDNH